MKEKRKTLARRLTGKILIWMIFVALGLSYLLVYIEKRETGNFYSEIYRNKMLVTNEYTRRVISDVYVAVTNNIYYLEQTLDNPDVHKATMERIVKSGTRVRSCGISFIENYYPQKGRHFCPYAWRNSATPDVTYTQDMGDADRDYLSEEWFLDMVEGDSAQWSDPFYDGYFSETPLSAYMVPIHDRDGRVVAVLGADVSLDWLTNKLSETDSTVNKNSMFMAGSLKMKSESFIINHDGTYLTHSEESKIMNSNFFSELEADNGSGAKELTGRMQAGIEPQGSNGRFIVNGEECYLFYTPVKYTKWLLVSVVPCQPIDMLGYVNAGKRLVIILPAMLLLLLVAYFYMKIAFEPLKLLTNLTDNISKGRFDTPVPDLKHNDEISQLRNSIGEMQFTLSTKPRDPSPAK